MTDLSPAPAATVDSRPMSPPGRPARLRDPLRRPAFRRLAISYAINEIGDWLGIVALSVLVFERTGSALATATLFLATRFLPALLAPVLATRAEQPSPRRALPVIYCGEAVAFAGLAWVATHFSLAGVVALAIVDGTLALTGRALTRAVVAALLEPTGELRAGNALLNIAFTGGAAVGPAIAGVVVGALGVPAALLLDAISFYAVGWILVTAGVLPHIKPETGDMRRRLRAGFQYIRGKPVLRRLLVAEGVAFVFFAAVLPVEVIYAKETLSASDSGYGLLLGSWGAGMVVGSLVFARARRARLTTLIFLSTATIGAGYLGLAVAPTLAIACAASMVGGAGNGVQWVAMVSAVQELTREDMQARVMGVLESTGAAMPGLGFLLGGLITAVASPRATFLVAGIGVMVVVGLASVSLHRSRDEMTGPEQGTDLDGQNEIVLELLPGSNPSNATRRL